MRCIIGKTTSGITNQLVNQTLTSYETFGYLMDLTEKEMQEISREACGIEPDFEVHLGHTDIVEEWKTGESKSPIFFATIGLYRSSKKISHYYEITTQHWEINPISETMTPWICCYSQEEWLPVSAYLNCIHSLHQMASQLKLKLVMVGNVESQLPYFKYRSLADAIVNRYLEKYDSLYFIHRLEQGSYAYSTPTKRTYEPYENHMIYTQGSEKVLKQVIQNWRLKRQEKVLSREQIQTLYQDTFYERIPPTQKIYVPLNLVDDKDCNYYKELGLETVCVGKQYTLIYDERQKIDALSDTLRRRVLPTYTSPIMSPTPIYKESISKLQQFQQIEPPLKYLGKNVYIGIIGTRGVDYRETVLRTESGKTRIASIWAQEEGNQGIYYTAAQINEALATQIPSNTVPLSEEISDETLVLEMAAGKNSEYEGLATEAEFLVAKIKSAPPVISKIYAGIAKEESVLMPDILVGISKMMAVAKQNNKPLVVYIPYNTNLSAHDGSSIYEEILSQFGMGEDFTFIVPTGEEGDKSHHGTLRPSPTESQQVTLVARDKVEQVTGVIYLRSIQKEPFFLSLPGESDRPVRLDEQGITKHGPSTIYSTGLQDDYQNGSRFILFSIEQMIKGDWQLVWKQEAKQEMSGYIELWLTQEALNPYVTLNPSTPFTTLGSNAAVDHMLSVASFDINDLVVLGPSGRGYAWDGTIKPICASQSMSPVVYQHRWQKVSGTAVAASMLLGSIATIYDKWQVELKEPYANSLLMSNLILSHLTQFPGETYPNKAQGYGVFEVKSLPEILGEAIH